MISLSMRLPGAVILTILLESLIVIPKFLPSSPDRKKLIINIILINIITNVALNLILSPMEKARMAVMIAGELLIPFIEAVLYEMGGLQMERKSVVAVCYLANAWSFGVGVVGGMIW